MLPNMRFQSPSTVPAKRHRGYGNAADDSGDDENEDDMEEPPPQKRSFKRSGLGTMEQKKPAGQGSAKVNSFAAKMMANMGYVAGQGLGKEGQGILNPVDTKLRPQGVGLGAVREKTEQAKAEEKRAAERRGEVYEDSSEEERRKRREKKARKAHGGSGTSTPAGFTKAKTKYRTAAEIEQWADGLEVPDILKSLIDVTGKEQKVLTSTAGLMVVPNGNVAAEPENVKIAKRARRDLENFADHWNSLADQKKNAELKQIQLEQDIQARQSGIDRLESIIAVVDELKKSSGVIGEGTDISRQWEAVTVKLEALEHQYEDELESYGLPEVAVAAIQPIFRAEMETWNLLDDPEHLVNYLERLRSILGIKSPIDIDALTIHDGLHAGYTSRIHKSTTPFETLLYTLWLPRVRTTINNSWNVYDSTPLINLLEAWRPFLPAFIFHNLIDNQIIPKLTTALSTWTPKKRHGKSPPPPHTFIVPFLPHLPAHHIDAHASTGLLADVKRCLRAYLSAWDLSSNQLLPGLSTWSSVLPSLSHLLTRSLLPRLATHLAQHLTINPSDQDMSPLEAVLLWTPYFKPEHVGELLIAEFFPKYHSTLHQWLTSEGVSYPEVAQWFIWWKARFPEPISSLPVVKAEWDKAVRTMEKALELGPRAAAELSPPPAGPVRPMPSVVTPSSKQPPTPKTTESGARARFDDETSFRDVLEAWCVEEDLILVPLREAHERTGLPLFRVTASASGKGGVLVYLKGDVVWAQKPKEKGTWVPVGLGEELRGWAGA
ncbi:MAG: hypothetical protein M1824_000011 [Vezdaea acicularis]|nr:MAG: hypothetical protein M1824_000011 [Vezdaea acicularis]